MYTSPGKTSGYLISFWTVDSGFSIVKRINMPYLLGPKGYLHCDAKLPFSYSFLFLTYLLMKFI